ncbi:hypothetical protein Q3G72_002841 [Acer saccharum]|nr:hypothetical protein Q3G72_002841 [Acer saccharum]
MRDNGVQVDSFTVPTVLKACSLLQLTQFGKEIHGFAVKNGLDCDVFVSNALIKMYAECGCMVSARLVFDEMSSRDVVSWSTMIGSYHKSRLFDEALNVVREMHFWRVRPSEVAMISMVGLFADIGDVEAGKAMHACVIRNIMSEKLGVAMATTLIDMYAKCGDIGSAKRVFDGLDERSVVSWTAMIAGCIRCNKFRESSRLFVEMLGDNVFPTEVTIRSFIIECGFVGGLGLGKFLHAYILRNEFDMSSAVGTALVDMYGKCGEIRSARALFDSMKSKDVMTWSAMISAYALARCSDKAFELFVRMKGSQVSPNEVTIVVLLSLCAETGALDMGKWIHAYTEKQGVEADVILETALVDMYANCGDIDGAYRLFSEAKGRDICMWNAMMAGYVEAHEMIKSMPLRPNTIVWGALLAASKIHKNPNIAEVAARELLEMEPQSRGYNVLMSNIYAEANRWNDVARVRRDMKYTRVRREPGLSSVEVNGSVCEFVTGDTAQTQNLYT